jgi:uncharacterized metal-binding protein
MNCQKINLDKKRNETHSSHNTKIKVSIIKIVITMESGRTEHKESQSGRTNQTEKSAGKRKNTFIFACSGLSNTGKLTMQAASALAFRRPDMYRAAAAQKGVDAVEDAVSEGFRILALDGCTDRCATKKLDEAGMRADIYMMVTELGIEKTRPSDVKPEYVEIIIRAIRDA